jgi:3-hydroxyisobutyrate dehydrogenase
MGERTAWIGLGVMGFPMAGHLAERGGHDVTVYNRSPDKAKAWTAKFGGKSAPTPAEAAKDADFVFACVGNDADVRHVTIGEGGAFHGMKPGAVFVDHTTASADVARELHAAAKDMKLGFIDAPVSGGQAGRGERDPDRHVRRRGSDYARVEPLIASYGRMCRLLGPAGSGQLTKMVNQICIAGLVQGLAEGIHFGKKAGLDIEAVIAVISKGAAQSWQMENRYKTMNEGKFDFGFAVDWMRKDLASASTRRAAPAPTCRWRRWSTSSIPRCRRWAAGAGTPRASSRAWRNEP